MITKLINHDYKIKNMKKILLILLIAFSFTTQAQTVAAKYKAMFTVNFIRYIGWPDAATKGDFIIGVLKDKAVLGFLQQQTVGKKFGFQNIVVKEFKSVNDITDCQILYVTGAFNFNK